jgi:hypothetical protein
MMWWIAIVAVEIGRPGFTNSDPRSLLTISTVFTQHDILPADLADVVRGGAGALQVNDADAGGRHGRNMVAQPANPKRDGPVGGAINADGLTR